jgi:hypothetical protein
MGTALAELRSVSHCLAEQVQDGGEIQVDRFSQIPSFACLEASESGHHRRGVKFITQPELQLRAATR